jgi:hypothetical protein
MNPTIFLDDNNEVTIIRGKISDEVGRGPSAKKGRGIRSTEGSSDGRPFTNNVLYLQSRTRYIRHKINPLKNQRPRHNQNLRHHKNTDEDNP